MDFVSNPDGALNQATIETNQLGEQNMYQNGELIATQKSGLFPHTTDTFDNGQKIAHTKENIINGTDIIQDGEHTGIIKEDVLGNTSLYDTNHNKIASIDPNGNIKDVMTHTDPLSQVNRVNFQQLKFHSSN
jgi:hypothetical protein